MSDLLQARCAPLPGHPPLQAHYARFLAIRRPAAGHDASNSWLQIEFV
jgi:hypothetical protein